MAEFFAKNIYIRFLTFEDSQALYEMRCKNKEFLQPFEPRRDPSFFTLEEQQRQIMRNLNDMQSDRAFLFGVFLRETKQLIGRIALTNIVRGPVQTADLGYFISEEHNGKGFATEAVKLVLKFAFTRAKLHRVQASAMPRNPASNRVLKKAGFQFEGVARKLIQINGIWEDHNQYAMIAEDYYMEVFKMNVAIKRIYDEPAANDGLRILVDRLWPRGVSKQKAQIAEWMKEIAPSGELREWFGHIPERFDEFRQKYVHELETDPARKQLCEKLLRLAAQGPVTLVYGAKDERHNQAVVLKQWLEAKLSKGEWQ
ncbi:MAG TPA: GNAT family N-acetyltransferase [Bacilli bacterium]